MVFKIDELFSHHAILLGRKTYEGFASVSPTISDEIGFADKMNQMQNSWCLRHSNTSLGTTRTSLPATLQNKSHV